MSHYINEILLSHITKASLFYYNTVANKDCS